MLRNLLAPLTLASILLVGCAARVSFALTIRTIAITTSGRTQSVRISTFESMKLTIEGLITTTCGVRSVKNIGAGAMTTSSLVYEHNELPAR
jgi:hypothetical protein